MADNKWCRQIENGELMPYYAPSPDGPQIPDNTGGQADYRCRPGETNCTTLPNGTVVTWAQDDNRANVRAGVVDWVASAVRPDGTVVAVNESNAEVPKVGPPSRSNPPFTFEELKAIVASSRWQAKISADEAASDAHLFTPGPTGTTGPTASLTH